MATRFYLSSTEAVDGGITPGFAAWTRTTEGDRRAMDIVKDGSAFTAKTAWAGTGPAANATALFRQYISAPLAAGIAFVTTDTVKAVIRVRESATNDNIDRNWTCIKVYAADGTTLQATLFALGNGGPSTTEWSATTLTNRRFLDGDTLAANYTTVAGDRLVVEFGGQITNAAAGTTTTGTMDFGSASANDNAEDDTTTTVNNPWIEFSRTITFLAPVEQTDDWEAGQSVSFAGMAARAAGVATGLALLAGAVGSGYGREDIGTNLSVPAPTGMGGTAFTIGAVPAPINMPAPWRGTEDALPNIRDEGHYAPFAVNPWTRVSLDQWVYQPDEGFPAVAAAPGDEGEYVQPPVSAAVTVLPLAPTESDTLAILWLHENDPAPLLPTVPWLAVQAVPADTDEIPVQPAGLAGDEGTPNLSVNVVNPATYTVWVHRPGGGGGPDPVAPFGLADQDGLNLLTLLGIRPTAPEITLWLDGSEAFPTIQDEGEYQPPVLPRFQAAQVDLWLYGAPEGVQLSVPATLNLDEGEYAPVPPPVGRPVRFATDLPDERVAYTGPAAGDEGEYRVGPLLPWLVPPAVAGVPEELWSSGAPTLPGDEGEYRATVALAWLAAPAPLGLPDELGTVAATAPGDEGEFQVGRPAPWAVQVLEAGRADELALLRIDGADDGAFIVRHLMDRRNAFPPLAILPPWAVELGGAPLTGATYLALQYANYSGVRYAAANASGATLTGTNNSRSRYVETLEKLWPPRS